MVEDPVLYGGIAVGILLLLVILWKLLKFAIKIVIIAALGYFGYQFLATTFGWPPLPEIPRFWE
ncbi:MAG TPA: hypothetical protein VNZ52_08420 [Candidatus Thermoplasmatota archaeon]|nr:hypothetical protein [Candidatus Thermoplasmatota archaeon]